jgi:hypothetical protein
MTESTSPVHNPLPKFSRMIIGVYLFAAPSLLMTADLLHFFHHYLIANVIFKMALVAFILGSFGLAYMFPEKAKYFGLAGAGMVALGCVTISAMSTETLVLDLVNNQHFGESEIKKLKQIFESADAIRVVYLPSGFAFPLGLVVLGIGLLKSPYTPRYISVILFAGAICHTIGRFVDNLSFLLFSEVVLFVASALTGWFMWRYKPDQRHK